MEVTVNVGGLIQYLLLGWEIPDDDVVVIGHSRIAYLSQKDPGHVLLPAAVWHDAAYATDASISRGPDAWPRWKVDAQFQKIMLDIAEGNLELEKEACTLYLTVRLYADQMYQIKPRLSMAVMARGIPGKPSSSLLHEPYVAPGSILSMVV